MNTRKIHFDSLPNELVSIIFCWVKLLAFEAAEGWSEDKYPEIHEEKLKYPEIHISHVSSRWRSAALATVQLWTNIFVSDKEGTLALARTYLERVQDSLLEVSLDIRRKSTGPLSQSAALCEVISLVFQHGSHLHRVFVKHSPACDDNEFFLSLHRLNAPQLQCLSLASDGLVLSHRADSDALLPPLLASGTPSLSFLRVRGQSLHFSNLPLSTVITLHLDLELMSCCLTFPQLKNILTATERLVNLSIQGHVIMGDDWMLQIAALTPSDFIHFPHLKSLRLWNTEGVTYSAYLNCFKAPNLSSLILKNIMENDLTAFFEAQHTELSFPALQSLTLQNPSLSVPALYTLFDLFKGLKHFALVDLEGDAPEALKLLSGMCNETNHASITIPSNYIALPDLKTLTVVPMPNATPGEQASMPEIIKYRESVSKPFKNVRLLVGSEAGEETLEELRQELDLPNVEFCQKIMDPWPPGLDFIDLHDDWPGIGH